MSARFTKGGAESVYAAAEVWKERALLADDSLFTPDTPIWTPELLGQIHTRFLDRPDTSGEGFLGKLEKQLAGSPSGVYQLMGEVLYVHFLPLDNRVDTKKSRVETVLGWSPDPVAIPPEFTDVFQAQFINIGAAQGYRPYLVGTLIETIEQWKGLEPGDREQLIESPWDFRDFLFSREFRSWLLKDNQNTGGAQRHLLLHILFPDTFERILDNDKDRICNAKAFAPFCEGQEADVDRKVWQIRQTIEGKLGRDFDFYDEDIIPYWKPPKGEKPVEVFSADSKGTKPSGESLQALAAKLYLPDDKFLKEIVSLLKEKRQVIFQGPPGTGKTYVAQKLARHLAGSGDDAAGRVRLVQFHPSYAYEDFVQGFRPTLKNGQAGFELRDGPLLQIAEEARNHQESDYYLIIDEINRGNLATVFGELYFLLEYRDAEISLQYSNEGEKFTLPKNLFIIGTMNTADRSIERVDLALRRRFYFVEFLPEEEPVKGVLRRYLEKNPTNAGWVVEVVNKANELLKDAYASDSAIGPSYFMQEGLTPDKVALIWKHSVLPYIVERLFDARDRLADFELDNLRKAVSGGSEDGDVSDTDEAGNGGE